MAYKAQLVVRTRDKQGAETIERVKELAEEQGKSFSEMAIELLDRGIGAPEGGAATAPPPSAGTTKSEPVAETKPEPEPVEPEPIVEKKKPEPVDLGPAPPVNEAAGDVEEALDADGIEAAAEALAEYFAVAGAVEGGKIKKELQKRLTAANYEEIMEIVKQSDQYRSYKDRVLFGT
jgi:hypothetical protein